MHRAQDAQDLRQLMRQRPLPPSFLDDGLVSDSSGALSDLFAGTGEPLNDDMMRLMSSSDGCSDSLGNLDIAANFAEA